MLRVLVIHNFELKPGASAEALEQLLAANPFPTLPGWTAYWTKGERGERTGKYAVIHEFESAEIRDRYFPSEGGEPNPDVQKLFSDPRMEALGTTWDKLATPLMNAVHTDYVVIG